MPMSTNEMLGYDPGLAVGIRNVLRHLAAAANTVTGTANAAAAITKAAVAGKRHVLAGVAISYSAGAAAGSLKVEDVSGTTVFFSDVNFATTGGQIVFRFDPPLKTAAVNTALIVTGGAGGGSTICKVNLLGYWTE